VDKGRICFSRKEHRVAFIRSKKVHGYEYYQVVRNYRDRDGKHQQEVLDHLGVHDSIEAAIAFRREKVASYLEQAKAVSRRVEDFKVNLQELYSDDLGGKIPRVEEAWDTYESLASEWGTPDTDWNSEAEQFSLDSERVDINLERAAQTIDYHELISQANQERALARHWQEKLNHLLNIQTTYF
jgi:hypothetical protein